MIYEFVLTRDTYNKHFFNFDKRPQKKKYKN